MRRALGMLLLAGCACAALACGKYGPPVRASEREKAAQEEAQQNEEATP